MRHLSSFFTLALITPVLFAAATVERDVPYLPEPHPERRLDFHWPGAAPPATVLFIHGGSPEGSGERRTSPLSCSVYKAFTPAGLACATTDHRLAPTVRLAGGIPDLLEAAEVPGISTAVVGGGAVRWTGAFGSASSESGAQITEDTVFEAASLSKPVFAYLVMRLVDQGRFSLDTPIASILPPPSRLGDEERYALLTPRILLSHRSGLPNWGGERLELAFDPGARFQYSGEGFVLLQRAVEKVTGSSLEELARKEVFEPLGMSSSSYVWREGFAERAAAGHDRLGRARPIHRPEEPNAAHSLLTTAPDLARFLAAVLGSRGLPEALRDQMLTPVVAMRGDELASPRPRELWEKVSWALGWGVQRTGDRALVWHWGDNGAFRSLLAGDPATGAGVVLLTNSENGLSVAARIARPIVGDVHWVTEWLGYDAYDSPAATAVRELRRTLLEESPSAGLARYRALREADPTVDDLEVALQAAGDLADLSRVAAAVELLQAARAHHPGSAELYTELGTVRVAGGEHLAAVESFERAVALADADVRLADLLSWTRELVATLADPPEVTDGRLEALAGSYGPRQVTEERGDLFYRRGGGKRYRLVPLSPDRFALEGLAGFRIRFVDDEDGRPVKIVGEYAGGETDETPRSED